MVMDQSDLANKISELCLNFYNNKLPNGNKYKNTEWTILSAIVMQHDKDTFDVVAMGTGTKCIGSNMLTANGDILNDSHAEVIARRAFLRFLLHQISALKQHDADIKSIFLLDDKIKRFKLMENVKFHMFTTSTPCGDSSIYATHDNHVDEPDTKRIKLNDTLPDGFTGAKLMFDEDVEDPMEQTEGKIRVKPGKGDRTMSLSCSDKIARWNLVGIQGCMLSSIIDPIYLESFVLADGTPYNHNAMERALYKRFSDAEKFLDSPFKLNKPKILIANNKLKFKFARNDERVTPSSNTLIYSYIPEAMRPIEVSVGGKRQGVTKKHLQSRKAHLKISKIELFTEYMNILNEFNEIKSHLYLNVINFNDLCYKDVKTLSNNEYYEQWKRLREGLLPNWTTKNENLSNFKSYFISNSCSC